MNERLSFSTLKCNLAVKGKYIRFSNGEKLFKFDDIHICENHFCGFTNYLFKYNTLGDISNILKCLRITSWLKYHDF